MQANKKILIVSSEPTHPTYAGNRACILSYAQMLQLAGYDVYYLWVVNYYHPLEEEILTQEYWKDKGFLFKRSKLQQRRERFYERFRFNKSGYYHLDDLYPVGLGRFYKKLQQQHQFKAVIINYIFLSKLANSVTGAKKLLFTHDVFTNKYQHTGDRWFSVKPNEEARALNRADNVLAIQEQEAAFFKYIGNTKVLTTYSYFHPYSTPYTGKKTLLYLAGPNKYNIEAITWFIHNVIKELVKVYPGVQLLVGGRICNAISEDVAGLTYVELCGDIDNMQSFYSRGDVVINPTFNGTGLKIKTFEAMAYGKVLVCHPHNQIGIYKEHEAPLVLASTADGYISAIDDLLKNADKLQLLKSASIKYIDELNSIVKSRFLEAIEN